MRCVIRVPCTTITKLEAAAVARCSMTAKFGDRD